MTREEAIRKLENHTQYFVPVDDLAAFETAIDALRAQQKLLEMLELDRDAWELCFRCQANRVLDNRFCCCCGRPLTEEAWAELEPEDIDALQKRENGLAELLVNISCGCAVTYTRLAELAQAEKDGRLVVLPCKPEQTIWVESCIRGRVTDIEAPDITWIIENTERFGKEIFLTREEAEAALKKREETGNETD